MTTCKQQIELESETKRLLLRVARAASDTERPRRLRRSRGAGGRVRGRVTLHPHYQPLFAHFLADYIDLDHILNKNR